MRVRCFPQGLSSIGRTTNGRPYRNGVNILKLAEAIDHQSITVSERREFMPSLKLACILLASGGGKRFGSNKLLADFRGQPLFSHVLKNIPGELFGQVIVVTKYAPVAADAAERGFSVAENYDETGDVAKTIRLGMEQLAPDVSGCMFLVGDQPLLRGESIARVTREFLAHPDAIVGLGCSGRRGNPVIFPKSAFAELLELPENQGGSVICEKHPERVRVVEATDAAELADVDTLEDLQRLSDGSVSG